MIIIGIDPGLGHTGWCVVNLGEDHDIDTIEACGIIQTSVDKRAARMGVCAEYNVRCEKLQTELDGIIATHKPSIAIVEAFSGSQSHRAGVHMSLSFATVTASCRSAGLSPQLLLVSEARRLLPRSTAADRALTAAKLRGVNGKQFSERVVKEIFGEQIFLDQLEGIANGKREHAYDAAALVVASMKHPAVEWARRWSMNKDDNPDRQAASLREAINMR